METIHSLRPVHLKVTPQAVRAYAELTDDFNPLHLDAEFAAKTPMGRPIAHGTMSLCLIWECLQRNLGPQVFDDLALDVRFVKPVFMDDELTAGGELSIETPHLYQVWVRGQDGSDRIVGTVNVAHQPTI
jgi:3-hydroxybutyryl-CoA dehydratase